MEVATTNPFPGLRPFEPSEADIFFGRESQIDELLLHLRRKRFTAVVGTSGSGKSSLVRAGLLPALEGGFVAGAASIWRVVLFRPGPTPIGYLAKALASSYSAEQEQSGTLPIIEAILRRGSLGLVHAATHFLQQDEQLLVVVDQFEELFTYKQVAGSNQVAGLEGAQDQAAAFVKLLLESVQQDKVPIYVVLTMRSDFLGDCSEFRSLPEAINQGLYLVPRMSRDQLRMAITGPVKVGDRRSGRKSLGISSGLVQRLLNDVGDDPDQLPVLQHCLMRVWDHRANEGAPLDLPHYRAVGGLDGALSQHADEAFKELDPNHREIAERTFRCLTEKGQDNREIRRATSLRKLCEIVGASRDEVLTTIKSFRREGRSFLTPGMGQAATDDTMIDISHESLIRKWGELRRWASEEADDRKMYVRIANAAAVHADGGPLWRGTQLELALAWRDRTKPTKPWALRYHPQFEGAVAFLQKSQDALKAERMRRRVRVGLGAVTVVAVLVVAAVYLGQQNQIGRLTTERNTLNTEKTDLQNKQEELKESVRKLNAGRVELTRDNSALAKEKAKLDAKTRDLQAQNWRRLLMLARVAGGERVQIGQESSGLLALEVLKRSVEHKDVNDEARKMLRSSLSSLSKPLPFTDHRPASLSGATLWQDGRVVAHVVPVDSERPLLMRVWKKASESSPTHGEWTLERQEDRGLKSVQALFFGRRGFPIAARVLPSRDSEPFVYVLRDPTAGKPVPLEVPSFEQAKQEGNKSGGRQRPRIPLVSTASFSEDGAFLAAGSEDGRVWFWTVATGRAALLEPFHDNRVNAVAISPDRQWIASASRDKWARIWKLDGSLARPLEHQEEVRLVAFSHDSKYVTTVTRNDVFQSDMSGQDVKPRLRGSHGDLITDLKSSHEVDVDLFVTASRDKTAKLWRGSVGVPRNLGHEQPVNRVEIGPKGQFVATATEDGTIHIYSALLSRPRLPPLLLGSERFRLSHGAPLQGLAFGDGSTVVSTARDASTKVWRLTKDQRQFGDTIEEISREACGLLSRHLTWTEWSLYLKDIRYEPMCTGTSMYSPNDLLGLGLDYLESDNPAGARELATRLAVENDANANNELCWQGTLLKHPDIVLPACERACKLDPQNGAYRDSRGVAYALFGKLKQAREDFAHYVAWAQKEKTRPADEIAERRKWIAELDKGRNPIDEKVLAGLRGQ